MSEVSLQEAEEGRRHVGSVIGMMSKEIEYARAARGITDGIKHISRIGNMDSDSATLLGFNSGFFAACMNNCYHEEALDDTQVSLKTPCPECGKPVVTTRGNLIMFGDAFPYCQECCDKHSENKRIEQLRDKWHRLCPKSYRDTDRDRDDWNASAYKAIADSPMNASFFVFGDSDTCKTRMGLERIKRALLVRPGKDGKGLLSVSVKFEEDLEEKPKLLTMKEWVDGMCKSDVGLFDNMLEVGIGDERKAKLCHWIIDKRLREGKATIITSRIALDDLQDEAAERFGPNRGSTKKGLHKRVESIVSKIQQRFKLVSTNAPDEEQGRF